MSTAVSLAGQDRRLPPTLAAVDRGFRVLPDSGIVGGLVAGRVDSPLAALIGGVATGAVIGLGQGLASSRRLPLVRWMLATAVGMGSGYSSERRSSASAPQSPTLP